MPACRPVRTGDALVMLVSPLRFFLPVSQPGMGMGRWAPALPASPIGSESRSEPQRWQGSTSTKTWCFATKKLGFRAAKSGSSPFVQALGYSCLCPRQMRPSSATQPSAFLGHEYHFWKPYVISSDSQITTQ